MNNLIHFKQKLSRSGIFNKLLQILPGRILASYPLKHIMIEPTNICNLRCLFCTQDISKRPKGMMTIEMFNEILPMLPKTVKEVQLHFAGEPMLNKDVPAMIKGLKGKGIKVIISSNGTLSFENYENAIRAGLDDLIISFDGVTKEVYEKYRRGGDFEKVVNNIKKMSELPNRKTEIIIQFLVMRHNENQIEDIKKLFRKVGADTLWLKSASMNIGSSTIKDEKILENAKAFLPENQKYSRYILSGDKLINKDRPLSCPWIFRTVILWNGDIAVCCTDLEGEIIVGNVLKERSFDKIWKSKKYQMIRRKILRSELSICQHCSIGDNPVKEVIKK